MTPKKYPQNLHTPKIFFFLKTPKNIEIQNFEQKKERSSIIGKITQLMWLGKLISQKTSAKIVYMHKLLRYGSIIYCRFTSLVCEISGYPLRNDNNFSTPFTRTNVSLKSCSIYHQLLECGTLLTNVKRIYQP